MLHLQWPNHGERSQVVERRQCPICAAEGKDTNEDNLAIYSDGHSYCYGCGAYNNSTFEGDNSEFTFEYLSWRGVQADVFRYYDAKTKIDTEGKPIEIAYRYPNGSHKIRKLDDKDFRWSKKAPSPVAGLWGKDKFAFGSHKTVTITEGELDACSLYQVIRSPVVSVRSATTATSDCAADRAFLDSFDLVYLAFDDDAVGRDATRAVSRLFPYGKVYVVRFSPKKDANDWMGSVEGEDQLKAIWKNSKVYLPENIISGFENFEKLLEGEPKPGIPYPFKTLTEMTYGMRTGEAVLVKAPEKVGKTSFMHALEYQLLKETDDNVAAIFLEEPPRRHLQAMAGLELRKPCHLPDVHSTSAEINGALKSLLRRDDRLFIYSAFGSTGGDQLLADIRYLVAGLGCRWVMLDPINIAVSAASREVDERKELEYVSTRLEMMLKELDFGLIFVSHVNDYGQTRGSHYLTKVADITIDIARDTLSSDPYTRNVMHLSIPYNRYCHNTGPAGEIWFDPETYTYSEAYTGNALQALEG